MAIIKRQQITNGGEDEKTGELSCPVGENVN
jgi:hypothetical protein